MLPWRYGAKPLGVGEMAAAAATGPTLNPTSVNLAINRGKFLQFLRVKSIRLDLGLLDLAMRLHEEDT
jgi:hypothetical protein